MPCPDKPKEADLSLNITPLRYQPGFEAAEPDEAETDDALRDTMLSISQKVAQDEGHAHRSVHAKSHGLLQGTLTVQPGLPPELAQGLCAQPGSYAAVMRLSSTPGDLLDDSVSTPRGMAVKVIGVPGERLPGSEDDGTQDLLMVNGPVFSAPTAAKFLKTLKLLAATTDKAPNAKKVLSAALRGLESLIEKAGGESGTLKALGGHPATHILGETFFTQVPMLWGPYMAKLSLAPVSPELQALTDQPIELQGLPDALRGVVREHFGRHGGTWALRVQLCTDIDTMPIEDATVEWPESDSPWHTVALLEVPPQNSWSGPRSEAIDDGMSFSPWHGLAAHRPIGSIMRVRKASYEAAAQFRGRLNGVSVAEPKGVEGLPR